jgi:hypothetical protein
MQYFLDARIGLDGVFGTSRVSLLVEMLAEARTSAERFAYMERFLAANLRERRVKPVACLCGQIRRSGPHDQRFQRDRRRAAGATRPPALQLKSREHFSIW